MVFLRLFPGKGILWTFAFYPPHPQLFRTNRACSSFGFSRNGICLSHKRFFKNFNVEDHFLWSVDLSPVCQATSILYYMYIIYIYIILVLCNKFDPGREKG